MKDDIFVIDYSIKFPLYRMKIRENIIDERWGKVLLMKDIH